MRHSKSGHALLIRGMLLAVATAGITGVCGFLVRRRLALDLSTLEYGFFYSAFAFVMLFVAYVDLGLNSSGSILIATRLANDDRRAASSMYGIMLAVKGGIGLLVVGALAALAPGLLSGYFQYPAGFVPFLLLILLVPVRGLFGGTVSACDASQDYRARNFLQLAQAVLTFGVIVVGMRVLPSLTTAAGAYLAGPAIAFVGGLLWLVRRHRLVPACGFGAADRASLHEAWHFGKWVAVATAATMTMFNMDTVMLTYMRGLESVALYNIALPIVQVFQAVVMLPRLLAPVAARLWRQRQQTELRTMCLAVVELSNVVFWLAILTTMLFGRDIITLLFDASFLPAAPTLVLLSAAMAVWVLAQFVLALLNATGQSRQPALIALVAVVVNIVANALLIGRFDIVGAAAATLISYLTVVGLGLWRLRPLLGVKLWDGHLPTMMAAGAIGCGLAGWLTIASPAGSPLPRAALLAAYLAVAFGLHRDLLKAMLAALKVGRPSEPFDKPA